MALRPPSKQNSMIVLQEAGPGYVTRCFRVVKDGKFVFVDAYDGNLCRVVGAGAELLISVKPGAKALLEMAEALTLAAAQTIADVSIYRDDLVKHGYTPYP